MGSSQNKKISESDNHKLCFGFVDKVRKWDIC